MPTSGLVAVPSKGLAHAGESPCSLRPVLGSSRRVLPWGHLTLTVGVGSRSGRRSAMGLLWGEMGRCLQQWGRDGAASHMGPGGGGGGGGPGCAGQSYHAALRSQMLRDCRAFKITL